MSYWKGFRNELKCRSYFKSLKNTINSGNISEDELVTERILLESFNNDELGESILEFDFEFTRDILIII